MKKIILPATLLALSLGSVAQASIIELELSATWTSSDFNVSSTGDGSGLPEANDDKVFGLSPYDGSINFTLLVDTSSVTSFLVGGSETVEHDHFGYSSVSLKSPVTLGSATWTTADILTELVGPGGVKAALWTDTDITTGDPSKVSFRMFGDWAGTGGTGTADLFFGSRYLGASGYGISDSFLAWEYYGGEEIRTTGYTATVSAVPVPASSLLLLSGLAGLTRLRKRKAA
jgi:hypothetical protein